MDQHQDPDSQSQRKTPDLCPLFEPADLSGFPTTARKSDSTGDHDTCQAGATIERRVSDDSDTEANPILRTTRRDN